MIEMLGKPLQIDVGSVHVRVEIRARGGVHIPGGHGDGFEAEFMRGQGAVDGVFGEDDRVIVSEGDAAAAGGNRGPRHRLGAWPRP